MRLILLTPFESLDAEHDVAILQARGYDAVSYYGLYDATYRLNRGMRVPVGMAHVNLLAELCEGAIPVVHPDSQRELVREVAAVCRFAHVPMLRMEDLPACPPVQQEVIDARNCVLEPLRAAQETKAPVPAMPMRHGSGRLRTLVTGWLAKADARLAWMKNPMARAQRAGVREYAEGGVPVQTTG